MIRLKLTHPSMQEQVLVLNEDVITIGRSPDNLICLNDLRISKRHGRILVGDEGFLYEDLKSTNGSSIVRGNETLKLTGKDRGPYPLSARDLVRLASFALKLDVEEPVLTDAGDERLTVVLSRPVHNISKLQAELVDANSKVADLLLRLVRETVGLKDEGRLLKTIADFVFEAFPHATHQVLVVRAIEDGRLTPLLARGRNDQPPHVALSRTIVEQVLTKGLALLFSHVQDHMRSVDSVVQSQIETAICAPLAGWTKPYGVIQVDIRSRGTGVFTKDDLDLLTVLATHVGLVLDNLRLYQEQHRAFESTIHALVHSLSLKDSGTAQHSERVQAISLIIGRELGIHDDELEVLGTAAILHDMGKHAVPDHILLKPARLTPEEYREISRHSNHTQTILDKIYYPEHLRAVPMVAAYHHEKMDGTGTYGIVGDEIPIGARIIAIADAFDALASRRSYKEPIPIPRVLEMLNESRDVQWDGRLLDVFERMAPVIERRIYAAASDSADAAPSEDAGGDDAAPDQIDREAA